MKDLIRRYEEVYDRFTLLYLQEFADKELVLTEREQTYLNLIYRQGRLTPSQFAELAQMTRAGATQTLNKYEERGWVLKQASSTDKRRIEVSLTAQLTSCFEDIDRELAAVYQRFFGILTAEEQEKLGELLTKLAQAPLAEKKEN